MALLTIMPEMRWSQPRKWMASNGVNVDISDSHVNYVDMYRFAKKTDTGHSVKMQGTKGSTSLPKYWMS